MEKIQTANNTPTSDTDRTAEVRRSFALKTLGTTNKQQLKIREFHRKNKNKAIFRHANLGVPQSKFKNKEIFRQCKRKNRYKTSHAAKITAEKVLRERGTVLHCYFCEFCNGYHLTKMSKKSDGIRAF